jgi:chemotaxis protein methyltransferase CheR
MTIGTVEFGFVADLVRREAAIVLEPGKEYLVDARLAPLARRAGVPGVNEFVRLARHAPTRDHRWSIVEALTTNETSWFRDPAVFEAFRRELLPRLIADRSVRQPLRIWSAAASTGQEAYSLAMLLADELPSGWRHEILGTDISAEVLERARSGVYSQMEMNRGLPAKHLVRFFQRQGTGWRVDDRLRAGVQFRELNLAGPLIGLPRFDVIFMRNVLIYFDAETKRSVLAKVRRFLAPDGWLVLGTAETTRGIDDQFEQHRFGSLTAYQPATPGNALPAKGKA